MAFPNTYNINYYEGDTYEFNISPKNSDGSAYDLTGFLPTFTIASTRGPAPDFSIAAVSSKNSTGTTILCEITPTVGRQLIAGTQYVYDVQISSGSKTFTLLTGTISVTADVTGA